MRGFIIMFVSALVSLFAGILLFGFMKSINSTGFNALPLAITLTMLGGLIALISAIISFTAWMIHKMD